MTGPAIFLPAVYICLTYTTLWLQFRFSRSDPLRSLMYQAIYYTLSSIYWLGSALVATVPFARVILGIGAGVSAYVAWVLWNRWNNRRRKRKGLRVSGKIGLRLGRLVIVPESI